MSVEGIPVFPSKANGALLVVDHFWRGLRLIKQKKKFKDFCAEYGSSNGQDLALTAVCVPSLLDHRMRQEVHQDNALTGLCVPISLDSGHGFHRVYEG